MFEAVSWGLRNFQWCSRSFKRFQERSRGTEGFRGFLEGRTLQGVLGCFQWTSKACFKGFKGSFKGFQGRSKMLQGAPEGSIGVLMGSRRYQTFHWCTRNCQGACRFSGGYIRV